MNQLDLTSYRHNPLPTVWADLIKTAMTISYTAHQAIEQVRKFTGEEYYNHPFRVAQTLVDHGFSPEIVATALLHDVIEDTGMEPSDLSFLGVPGKVITNVEMLSEDKSIARDIRKADTAQRALSWPLSVCVVKLADITDNYGGIPLDETTPEMSTAWKEKYFKEGQRLVKSIMDNPNVTWTTDSAVAKLLNSARQAVGRINTVNSN